MSGLMKAFFDRCTDLLTIEQPLGRQFRGKKMAVISSSNGNHLGEQFWLPFQHTANYLGMEYWGHAHFVNGQNHDTTRAQFLQQSDGHL